MRNISPKEAGLHKAPNHRARDRWSLGTASSRCRAPAASSGRTPRLTTPLNEGDLGLHQGEPLSAHNRRGAAALPPPHPHDGTERTRGRAPTAGAQARVPFPAAGAAAAPGDTPVVARWLTRQRRARRTPARPNPAVLPPPGAQSPRYSPPRAVVVVLQHRVPEEGAVGTLKNHGATHVHVVASRQGHPQQRPQHPRPAPPRSRRHPASSGAAARPGAAER